MSRALVDTNVLASGFTYQGSIPDQLLRAWLAGCYELAISEEILTELERTLHKPYFFTRLGVEQIQANLALLRRRASVVSLTAQVRGVATHPEDDLVLAATVSAHSDYLVTGDGPFRRRVPTYQGVSLISPRDFLELLELESAT